MTNKERVRSLEAIRKEMLALVKEAKKVLGKDYGTASDLDRIRSTSNYYWLPALTAALSRQSDVEYSMQDAIDDLKSAD